MWALWIAGEGPARSAAGAHRSARAGDRIALLGWVEDTVELLHALDLYALSSVREGLPIALLEAMAMRLPVVATSVGGVVALVGDGENGVLVTPRDVDGLATAMRRLLDDAPLRDRVGVAARRTIEERFTLAAGSRPRKPSTTASRRAPRRRRGPAEIGDHHKNGADAERHKCTR
jgi:glycosyltransferase involved in cell wall biosynthesis